MTIYTIGFTKKTAERFFETLRTSGTEILIDIRLNNRSQLAGFTKDGDIQYFLDRICCIPYVYCEEYAPSKELLSGYQKKEVSWEEYEAEYARIMEKRDVCRKFWDRFSDREKVCLLCSEPTPEHCHRRLLAEMIAASAEGKVEICHL